MENEAVLKEAVEDITDRAWMRVAELERKRRRGAWVWMSAAAAVVLLVTTTFFVVNSGDDGKPDTDKLFSENFQTYPAPAKPNATPSPQPEKERAEQEEKQIEERKFADAPPPILNDPSPD